MFSQLLNISSYYFNPYALPVFAVGVLTLSIGFFVLKQNKKSIRNIACFLQCFSTGFWLFTITFVYLSRSQQVALSWYRYFTFFGVVNIMPSLIFLGAVFLGEFEKRKKFIIANYAISFVFYLLALTTDKVVISYDIRKYFWGFYPIYGTWAFAFIIIYSIQFIIGFARLFNAFRTEPAPLKKIQIKTIAIATLIAFPASLDFLPKFFNIPLYPFGYIPMFIYISIVAYSIVKYRAFDIETVLHKTAMWLLTSSFIIIPLFFLYKWSFPLLKESVALQIVSLVTTFLFLAFYLRMIQPKIDHLFQRRQSNLAEISDRFTEDLVHLKGLSQLIQRIKNTIADTLYSTAVDIDIYNESGKNHNQFLNWLAKNNKIAYSDFLDIDPAYVAVKSEAENYFNNSGAVVIIPLALNEKLLGVIKLRKKANLKRYSAFDFRFLTLLKNQAAIAISNSLLYENMEEQVRQRTRELLEVQRQLVQAEKLATVGTLAGGVAHEINNPLTAILTNVQMLLASGPADANLDKESLELIEEATKRCRTIVQKLMAFAKKRLENAEISEVNLSSVLKNVQSFLAYQLEQENIKLSIDAKEDGYPVLGNQNELEQVITNIVLNAKDAIKQIKNSGRVLISLKKNEDWEEISIQDDGSGIKKELLPKIFDPFFTTKDVGKGTGLGLSICQSIIEKHKGTISVKSELNKGTIFIIRLPQAKRTADV